MGTTGTRDAVIIDTGVLIALNRAVTVAGGGTGLKVTSYALPINSVLAIARQIDDKARHTS